MSEQIDNGGPAFPCPEAAKIHYGDASLYVGMTLRDYFAAAALNANTSSNHDSTP
jgi:vacuolar-type H+-ATPase catalytic subunit A/Vma1